MDERFLLSFDWLLFLAILALSGAGMVAIWSTTDGTNLSSYFGRQLIYLCFGLGFFFALLYFDYHVFSDLMRFIYPASLLVLVLVLAFGQSVHGNKSWISLGGIPVQPSELIKIVVVVALAKYYAELDQDFLGLRELFIGGLIVLVPVFLIVMQGDLGTAVTILPIYMALVLLGGIRRKHVVAILLILALAAPVGWLMLRGYQRGRIESIFDPSGDPLRMGYQTIQSKIAVGSGKLLGKGFKKGSQGNLGFLPARHTDFVFAVLAEEKGFVGSSFILALFALVAFRLFRAACEAKDKIGTMIVAGVMAFFLFHVAINVGMVEGLLPIAGIPLPFVSAGGSSLISCFAAMSLCMNVRMRRYVN